MMKEILTIDKLKAEAQTFCIAESKIKNKFLFGVTDGKAVGTQFNSININGTGYKGEDDKNKYSSQAR